MRGKVAGIAALIAIFGITPAYAGKSQIDVFQLFRSEDHPRLCGEKSRWANRKREVWGSPPPMRGKVADKALSTATLGITPAYAGKR